MKKLNVNLKKEPPTFEETKKLELALEVLMAELSPEEREQLEEVVRTKGAQILMQQINKPK